MTEDSVSYYWNNVCQWNDA